MSATNGIRTIAFISEALLFVQTGLQATDESLWRSARASPLSILYLGAALTLFCFVGRAAAMAPFMALYAAGRGGLCGLSGRLACCGRSCGGRPHCRPGCQWWRQWWLRGRGGAAAHVQMSDPARTPLLAHEQPEEGGGGIRAAPAAPTGGTGNGCLRPPGGSLTGRQAEPAALPPAAHALPNPGQTAPPPSTIAARGTRGPLARAHADAGSERPARVTRPGGLSLRDFSVIFWSGTVRGAISIAMALRTFPPTEDETNAKVGIRVVEGRKGEARTRQHKTWYISKYI